MAEFVEGLNGLIKPFLPYMMMDLDPSLEIMSQFGELSEGVMENPSLVGLMGFSNESYLSQPPEFSIPFADILPGLLPVECPKPAAEPLQPIASLSQGSKKRKAKAESISGNSSVSRLKEDGSKKRNSSGGVKRGRNNSSKDAESPSPKEVVHVRARRGQATDSHSLAERVRREKINERMRYLQDLVPGCYKTMGMAVMLDEIINYVQSLQNQVEFLSMKLSAASSFCDFNLDMEAMATPQVLPRVGNGYEAQDVERLVREGYGGCTNFHSSMPPF